MSIQASKKHGVQSSSRKAATSRHGVDPQPRTQPVAGAFGREGSDRRTPKAAGPLRPKLRLVARRATTRQRAVGISNLPPKPEQDEQRLLPPRWHRKRSASARNR